MNYIKESFIPDKKITLSIVDKRLPKDMEEKFKNFNIKLIKSTGIENIYEAIKYHPDIHLLKLDFNNIVVAPNVYKYYKEKLEKYNFNVIKGESFIENKYPQNIMYNVCIFGNFAVHNFKYTDKKILNYLDKNNFTKINVNQGYCKCMICVVDENSIITSDVGIYNEVKKHNIDCLLIENGHIDLFELNYGFIGGASGLISNGTLAFLGDISLHPNYKKIKEFVNSKNKKIISLSKNKLLDLGSIIPLM